MVPTKLTVAKEKLLSTYRAYDKQFFAGKFDCSARLNIIIAQCTRILVSKSYRPAASELVSVRGSSRGCQPAIGNVRCSQSLS